MAKKHRLFYPSFDEFPSVSRDEWWQALTSHSPNSRTTTHHSDDDIVFLPINTEAQLPPFDTTHYPAHPSACAIEACVTQSPDRERLQSLAHLKVSGLYGLDKYITQALPLLPALDHPFSLLSTKTDDSSQDKLLPYLHYLRDAGSKGRPVQGTIYLPITHWSQWQANQPNLGPLAKLMNEISDLPALRVLAVGGDTFHAWGASAVDELAMTLSGWVAYCDQLTDLGVSVEEIMVRTEITLSSGTDFFLDLAKFRALPSLIDKIKEAYGITAHHAGRPCLRVVPGVLNKTFYDPDSNILRNTTEALAAMLGGAATLALQPHDFLYSSSGSFGERIAIQGYHVLRHEAHIGKVEDPAAGSYFVEDITRQLVEKSWETFLEFEDQGGFEKLLRDGMLQARCQRHLQAQTDQVSRQKKVLVGATRYTNALERAAGEYDVSIVRLATSYERIRNTMDRQTGEGKVRPTVHLWIQQPMSSAAVINQRVNYVKDLLTSVGLAYEEHRFTNEEEYTAAQLSGAHPIGLIFCGTDAFYEATVASLLKTHHQPSVCRYVAGGSEAVEEVVRRAGGSGVVGIGHDVVSALEQISKQAKL